VRGRVSGSEPAGGFAPPGRDGEADQHPVEWSPAPYERQFGRFAARLGEGASKLVFRAVDMGMGRLVAWNEVDLTCLSPEERDRVAGEVELLRQVRHPCIMEFIASWDAGEGKRVFITAICETGDLRRFYASHPVKLKIIKRWCRQLISAIAYLHAFSPPVVHRDIKCENILYDTMDGTLRLTDFGLGTRASADGTCSLTLGTPNFMAPEMWYGEAYDESVDVYAFGMTVLEMVARELPYAECTNPGQILRRVSQGILPDAYHRVRFPSIQEFISFCVTVNPETGRRPTAEQVKAHPFLSEALHPPEDEESSLVVAYVDPVCGGDEAGTGGSPHEVDGGGSAPFPPRLEVHSSRFPTVYDAGGSPFVTPHVDGHSGAAEGGGGASGVVQRDSWRSPSPPEAAVDLSAISARSGPLDGEVGVGAMVRRSPRHSGNDAHAPMALLPTLSLASAVSLHAGDAPDVGATARSDGDGHDMDGNVPPGLMSSGGDVGVGDAAFPAFLPHRHAASVEGRHSGDFTARALSEEPGNMTHIHALQQEFGFGDTAGGSGLGGDASASSFMSPPPYAVGAMSRPLGVSHGGASTGSENGGSAVERGSGGAAGSLYGSQSSLNPALFHSGVGAPGGGSDGGAIGSMLRHAHGGSMDGSGGGLDVGASHGSVVHWHRGAEGMGTGVGDAMGGEGGGRMDDASDLRSSATSDVLRLHDAVHAVHMMPGGGSGDDHHDGHNHHHHHHHHHHHDAHFRDTPPDGVASSYSLLPPEDGGDDPAGALRHASFDGSTGVMQPPSLDEVPHLGLEHFSQGAAGIDGRPLHLDSDIPTTARLAVPGSMTGYDDGGGEGYRGGMDSSSSSSYGMGGGGGVYDMQGSVATMPGSHGGHRGDEGDDGGNRGLLNGGSYGDLPPHGHADAHSSGMHPYDEGVMTGGSPAHMDVVGEGRYGSNGGSMDDVGGMVDAGYQSEHAQPSHHSDGYPSHMGGAPEPLHLRSDSAEVQYQRLADGVETAYDGVGDGRGGDGGHMDMETGETPWGHGDGEGGFAAMPTEYAHLHHGGGMHSGYGDDAGTTTSTPAGTLDMLSPGMFSPTDTYGLGGATPAGHDSVGAHSEGGGRGMEQAMGLQDARGLPSVHGDGVGVGDGDDITPGTYQEDRSPAADMLSMREVHHPHPHPHGRHGDDVASGDASDAPPLGAPPHHGEAPHDSHVLRWAGGAHGRQVSGFSQEPADHSHPHAAAMHDTAPLAPPPAVVLRVFYQDRSTPTPRTMCMMVPLDGFDWRSGVADEQQAASVCERLGRDRDAAQLARRLVAMFALLRLCPSSHLQVGPLPEHGWLGLWMCAAVVGDDPAAVPPTLVPQPTAVPPPASTSTGAAPFSPADAHASLLRGPVPDTPLLTGSLHHATQATGGPPPVFTLDGGGSDGRGQQSQHLPAPPPVHTHQDAAAPDGGAGGVWSPHGGDGVPSTSSTAPKAGFMSPSPLHGSLLRPGAKPPTPQSSPLSTRGGPDGGVQSPASPRSSRSAALSAADPLAGSVSPSLPAGGSVPRGLSGAGGGGGSDSGEAVASTPAPTSPGEGSPLTTATASASPRRLHGAQQHASAGSSSGGGGSVRDRATSDSSSISASSGAVGSLAHPSGGSLLRRTSGIPPLPPAPASPPQRHVSLTFSVPSADSAAAGSHSNGPAKEQLLVAGGATPTDGATAATGEDPLDRFITQHCITRDGKFGLTGPTSSTTSAPAALAKPLSSRSTAADAVATAATAAAAASLNGVKSAHAVTTPVPTTGGTPTGGSGTVAAQPITPASSVPVPLTTAWMLAAAVTAPPTAPAVPARSAFAFVDWGNAPAPTPASTHLPLATISPGSGGSGAGSVAAAAAAVDPFAITTHLNAVPAAAAMRMGSSTGIVGHHLAPQPAAASLAPPPAAVTVPSHVFDIR